MKREVLTIRCDYSGTPRDTHETMDEHSAAAIYGAFDKATS